MAEAGPDAGSSEAKGGQAEATVQPLLKEVLELPDGRYLVLYSRPEPEPGDA